MNMEIKGLTGLDMVTLKSLLYRANEVQLSKIIEWTENETLKRCVTKDELKPSKKILLGERF